MCGIAGIISKTPRAFDYGTFCTLGIANDTRGGDSCGIFIDGVCDYGVDKKKLFTDYFMDSEILNNVKISQIALLHCRKASVGSIGLSTAQPVVLYGEDGPEFIVMHNGTIRNYEELAKKYIPDINITGMTDSQVMARIFYYKGYEVLREYIGAAVFVIVDYRSGEPVTKLFKGRSKLHSYSVEESDERPLYYCITNGELVFSSIWTYLVALRKDSRVYSLRANELLEFNGKNLVTVEEIDRSRVAQTLPSKYYDNNSYLSNYLSIDLNKNIYSYNNARAHFVYNIDNIGRLKIADGTDVYFFDGVALKNKACYDFLTNLRIKSKLPLKIFSKRFENVIRYLSVDQVYPLGDLWYRAVSPLKHELFSGIYNPIISSCRTEYKGGIKLGTTYLFPRVPMSEYIDEKKEFNFKKIREECKSLMK